MPRNRSLFWIAILTAGCAQPRVQPAFVDVDRVLATVPIDKPDVVNTPTVAAPVAAQSASVPATPAREVRAADTEARRQAILKLIAQNKQIAESELAKRLREAYLSDVDRLESDLLAGLDDRKRELMTATFGALRPIFEEYARRRTHPLIRISLWAGFPDPDPNSRRPVPEGDPVNERRTREVMTLREDLKKTEAWYQGRIDEALQRADEQISQEILSLRIELEKQRLEAEARARREAAEQVKLELADIKPSKVQTDSLRLSGSPGATVSVPGGGKPRLIPAGPDPSATIRKQTRAQIEVDAKVWASVTGYALSTQKTDPDKTNEFLAWRRRRHVGP